MYKFSVSMCVYGKDNPIFFDLAVQSVLEQTVVPSEIILVVDGPVPDELARIIKKYEEEECFQVIWLPENVGHGNARRIGLEACTNELIALMDSDDISVRTRFEKQLSEFKKNNSLSVVGGNIAEFIESPDVPVGHRIVPSTVNEFNRYMKKRCPMNQVTVMLKKSAVMQVGGYLDWYCNEDYYLWLRMWLSGCKFYNIPEVLVYVRVGRDMYKRRGGWKYCKSELKLQKFMLKKKIINIPCYMDNCIKRIIIQVLLPDSVRGWVFKTFAREKKQKLKL